MNRVYAKKVLMRFIRRGRKPNALYRRAERCVFGRAPTPRKLRKPRQ
jgi:hypothetical protein